MACESFSILGTEYCVQASVPPEPDLLAGARVGQVTNPQSRMPPEGWCPQMPRHATNSLGVERLDGEHANGPDVMWF